MIRQYTLYETNAVGKPNNDFTVGLLSPFEQNRNEHADSNIID